MLFLSDSKSNEYESSYSYTKTFSKLAFLHYSSFEFINYLIHKLVIVNL